MTQAMHSPPRRALAPWAALLVGLAWLYWAGPAPWPVTLLGLAVALPILAAATGLLLWPGERQARHALALAGLVSMALALLLWPSLGWAAPALIAGGPVCYLVAGYSALRQQALPLDVPRPRLNLANARKVAADEALLGVFLIFARIPRGAIVDRDVHEIAAMEAESRAEPKRDIGRERPANTRIRRGSLGRVGFHWLEFDSGYRPDIGRAGAARWRHSARNARAAVRLFQHADEPRPWLICIHGYRMGIDAVDLSLFRALHLHHSLGLNVAMPILPRHGRRGIARLSGDGYLDGALVDIRHAVAQGLGDLRQLMRWIEHRQAGMPIGVMGYSLGGYHAALMANHEPDLACVIAGIPLVDIPATLWSHMPVLARDYLEARDLTPDRMTDLLGELAPLGGSPLVPRDRLHLFAATADQLVDPGQPLALLRHWGEPDHYWYHGAHLSIRSEPGLRPFIDRALERHGLVAGREASPTG